jgi:hypothetical protein
MNKILIAVALSAVGAYATNVCDGGPGTSVNVYSDVTLTSTTILALDSADSCTAGSFTFSNFQVACGAGAYFTSPATGFSLTVVVGGALSPSEVEFEFTNLGSADIQLYYTITGSPTNMTLMGGTTSSVSEVICNTAYDVPNSTCLGSTLGMISPLDTTGSTSATTAVTGAAEDFVVKDIAGGSELFQSIAPEPMTLSLMGVGLLGIGFLGRKLRK